MKHLVLWRHADAGDALADPAADRLRPLSAHGRRQAREVARWLAARLPPERLTVCSPAPRARQTAEALDASPRIDERLAPERMLSDYLELLAQLGPTADMPADTQSPQALVIVAHQPVIGELCHRLLGMDEGSASVRKGAIWWFRFRERADSALVLHAVIGPEMLG
ncbi:MAG: histidine phosphatase family protein [Burkholderiaceae bacterium]